MKQGNRKARAMCAFFAALIWPSCGMAQNQLPKAEQPGNTEKAVPTFPYRQGWLGADAAYSIPLSEGKSLWLFGDTFVGGRSATVRTDHSPMPRNSIGISQCDHQRCTIDYFWTRMYRPHPRAFFDLAGADWFWPLDGFIAQGKLYVVLEEMRTAGTGAFGFANNGITLATIANFHDSPSQWKIQYQKVLAGDMAVPGVAVVAGQPNFNPYPKDLGGAAWVYFFTLRKLDHHSELALTRLPIDRLDRAAQTAGGWQYLSGNENWQAWMTHGTLPDDAKTVMHAGYTEFTVRYHAAEAKWVAVAPSTVLGEGRAVYSLAPAIDGPWQEQQTLLLYPEMKKDNPDHTANLICYAAKEHPEFESTGSLMLTYACNSLVEEEVFKNMDLYHPIVVTRPMPQ
jgi:hypothetical protein